MKFQSFDGIKSAIFDEGPVTESQVNYSITFRRKLFQTAY